MLSGSAERIVSSLYSGHASESAHDEIAALDIVLQQWLDRIPDEVRWTPAETDPVRMSQVAVIIPPSSLQIKVMRSACVSVAWFGYRMAVYRSVFWPSRRSEVALTLTPALETCHEFSHLVECLVQRNMTSHLAYVVPVAIQAILIIVLS
jgi:hypothetical protein